MCNEKKETAAELPFDVTEDGWKSFYVPLPRELRADQVRISAAGSVDFSETAVLNVQDEPEKGIYFAYGQGECLGRFSEAGDALEEAWSRMGYVRRSGTMFYCRAATASARTLRITGDTADRLMAARSGDAAMLDLYGAPLRSTFYYISRGTPVLCWSDGGVPLILYAYDQTSVSFYSPQDGTWLRLGMKEAETMFVNGKNDFSCMPAGN